MPDKGDVGFKWKELSGRRQVVKGAAGGFVGTVLTGGGLIGAWRRRGGKQESAVEVDSSKRIEEIVTRYAAPFREVIDTCINPDSELKGNLDKLFEVEKLTKAYKDGLFFLDPSTPFIDDSQGGSLRHSYHLVMDQGEGSLIRLDADVFDVEAENGTFSTQTSMNFSVRGDQQLGVESSKATASSQDVFSPELLSGFLPAVIAMPKDTELRPIPDGFAADWVDQEKHFLLAAHYAGDVTVGFVRNVDTN